MVRNHHLTSVSTSYKIFARPIFFPVEPISGGESFAYAKATPSDIYSMITVYARRGRPQQYCVYDAQGRVIIITTNKTVALRYRQSVHATKAVPSV